MSRSVFARALVSMATTACAVLAWGVASTPAQASPSTVAAKAIVGVPSMSTDAYEKKVRYWVNRKRAARGLVALRHDACTDRVAERWGEYLSTSLQFFHQSMQDVLRTCKARYAGETLAKGPITPKHMVRLWMNSPGHRAIILSKHPRRIGVGAYPDLTGSWVVAANFTRF